jgi:xanthine dehydrogenase molybdopterin-binding subunit B
LSIQGIGEAPLLTSCSAFFALKEAITAARIDAGMPPFFKMNSPATIDKVLLAIHSAEVSLN